MNLANRIRRFAVLPALLTFLVAGLGALAHPAHAQNKTATKHRTTTTKSEQSRTHKTSAKRRVLRRHRRQRGQRAPTAERISEIQSALSRDGSYAEEPTGKWDGNTVEAMRKFQAAHGLNPSGKIDALTLQKLGLGSETAGVAAPLPPVSSLSGDAAANSPQTTRRQ